jgi:hypothetical protein
LARLAVAAEPSEREHCDERGIWPAAQAERPALADEGNRDGITRLVFVSVLPLFGTWVGTVLAFYFISRNLETATATNPLP